MRKASVTGIFFVFSAAIFLTVIAKASGQEAVPLLINYQGEIKDPVTGNPVPDGAYDLRFRMYAVETGGTHVWEETHSATYGNAVEVADGIFSVVLGSGTGDVLSRSIFGEADRWLEIRVGTETLTPRQRLTSAAYSIVSEDSRLLDGRQASEFAEAVHAHSGSDITTGIVSHDRIDPLIARDTETDAAVAAHAAIPNAHHPKTTSFSELTDAATDAQIPAAIARDSEVTSAISTHAADSDAHHARYTDGEAVSAMGTKADTNPLHHDKTTSLPWGSITSIPAGFADGIDNDSGAEAWSLTGNAGTSAGVNFLGTTDGQPLELRVGNGRALRLEPDATSPNVIGGHSDNSVASGVHGASIGGGGEPGAANRVSDHYGTVGGGIFNRAGNEDGDPENTRYATVGGGQSNLARGNLATISGGFGNEAGDGGTVSGGERNVATGSHSAIGGGDGNEASASNATIGGGYQNEASNNDTTVGGGISNTASGLNATIGGGAGNVASWDRATIAGGESNTASAWATTVGGGFTNAANGDVSTIGGGRENVADGWLATIGGGYANVASNNDTTVGGGKENAATGLRATISGGELNQASGSHSAIGGGYYNHANASYATIAGGGPSHPADPSTGNLVTDDYGTIGGGGWNRAGDNAGTTMDAGGATVAGGYINVASGGVSTVSGGNVNTASGRMATVSGGEHNTATEEAATIGGGEQNTASGWRVTISGGYWNNASGNAATVGGGEGNTASNQAATVGGGNSNNASGNTATVGGGKSNTASNEAATVGGGNWNVASGYAATVGGGYYNHANASYATIAGGGPSDPTDSITRNLVTDDYGTIGGGGYNQAGDNTGTTTDAWYATVGGGAGNTASNAGATVGGGAGNTASGAAATIPGGNQNTAVGMASFAAGWRAQANHDGAFVWGDSQDGDIGSTKADEVTFRCLGGVRFTSGSGSPNQTVSWSPGNSSWSFSSDRELKENFVQIDPKEVLERISNVSIREWNFKGYSQRHIGPVAQDFHALFPLGGSDTMIDSGDLQGVSLAAIQGLHEIVQEKDVEISTLKARVEALEALVEKLVESQGGEK